MNNNGSLTMPNVIWTEFYLKANGQRLFPVTNTNVIETAQCTRSYQLMIIIE